METLHAEGESPFLAHDPAANSRHPQSYVECPVDGCEEIILARAMNDHLEFHVAQDESMPTQEEASQKTRDTNSQARVCGVDSAEVKGTSNSTQKRPQKTTQSWMQLLFMQNRKGSPRTDRPGPPSVPKTGRSKLGVCLTRIRL